MEKTRLLELHSYTPELALAGMVHKLLLEIQFPPYPMYVF